ncbi:hypothetical protein HDU98_001680 [Podochytrium sp. JEL0797]|nr:hypothetical protein HDU98_001680 [Podochytrium sp. JEL0797]
MEEGLLERKKKRKQKKAFIAQPKVQDTQRIPEQLQPQPHQQISFDALIEPSAPAFDHPEDRVPYPLLHTQSHFPPNLEYPTADLIMSDLNLNDSVLEPNETPPEDEEDAVFVEMPVVQAAISTLLACPSAPPMELHENIANITAPVPLEDDILDRFYVNTQLQELQINDFRNNAKYLLTRDEFFETVLEYEHSFSNFQASTAEVKSTRASIDSLTSKIWTMKKSTQKLSSRCLDGVTLVHMVTSETAILNPDDLELLKQSLTVTLSDLLYQKKKAAFQMKMLKLWIQAHVDEHLNAMDQSFASTASLPDSSVEKLKYFLDVLFFFERRKDSAGSSERNVEDSSTTPVSTTSSQIPVVAPSTLMDSTLFMRDIRGWISHIVGFFQKAAPNCHSFLLLHVLRCMGIGSWGNWFIQWHPPAHSWTDASLDGFLTELHIFFSPVEELQEEQHVRDIELTFLAEGLRVLEESEEWVVVKETEVAEIDTVKAQLTLLSDENYVTFFKQFNLEAMYYSFLQSSLEMYKNDAGINLKQKDQPLLRVFAITTFIFERLSRGLSCFSSRRYQEILKSISRAVVNLVKILEDSVKAALGGSPVEIVLTLNSMMSTSVQSELDGCFVRAVSILLNRTRAGSWEYLTILPCDLLSDHMKFFLVNSILNGEPLSLRNLRVKLQSTRELPRFDDSNPAGLGKVIASNHIEARYLLSFLTRLCLSGSDSGFQTRLRETIAKAVFYFGFMDVDYRTALQLEARTLLSSICASQPSTISLLVAWTRKNFPAMGHLSKFLFQGLPLHHWCPNTSDFDGFIAMLRDPVKSDKFELAKLLLGGLNWGFKSNAESDLFIPRSFHRFLALSLCNLYLDRVMKVPMFSVSSALSTTAAITKGNIGALIPLSEGEFYDWCWNMVLKLSLFQQPTSLNTYSLESTSIARSKPFESLESAQLATLRGAMKSKSLVAYTLLMISDVGHSMAAFEKDGWVLLQVLLDDGRYDSVVCVVNELFLAFAVTEGLGFASTKICADSFTSFTKSCPKTALTPDKLGKNFGRSNGIACVQWFLLWLRVAFSDPEWTHNRSCVQLLDSLSQISLLDDQYHLLCTEFQREYVSLVSLYQRPSAYNNMSLFHPVESFYTVANTIGDYLSSYPTLVTGNTNDWYNPIPSTLRGATGAPLPSETEFVWFAFLALVAETHAEAPLRMQVGHELSKDSQACVGGVVKGLQGKPVEMFVIYRWCGQILECGVRHSLLPLMIQAFFSLFFEKAKTPVVAMNAVFGFRFFSESRHLLDKLQKKLVSVILELGNGTTSSSAPLSAVERERLCGLYKAALKWLQEPQLLSPNLYLNHLDPSFCPKELVSIIHQSPCTLSPLWMENVSAELFNNVFHVSDANPDDEPNTPPPLNKASDLYIKETSLPGMPWTPRQTIVTSSTDTTLAIAANILKQDYQFLLVKSRDNAKIDTDQSRYDSEYLRLLNLVYTNATKPGRYERKCGSACMGAAPFRYSYQYVEIRGEVKQALRENRGHWETLSEWENVDSRVCVSTLRIVRMIEWMKKWGEEGAASRKGELEELFVPFFFKMVALEEGVRRYPPFAMVLDRAVQLIGGLYVRGSRRHTMKVFDVVRRGGAGDLGGVVDAFNPAVVVDEFCDMYEVCSAVEGAVVLLGKFDVKEWVKECGVELQDEFLRVVCGIFERVESGALVLSPDGMGVHLAKLDDFLTSEFVGERLVEYIMRLMDLFVAGSLPQVVFVAMRDTLNCKAEFSIAKAVGYELLELQLSRSQSMGLVERLNGLLSSAFRQNVNGIYGMDHTNLQHIIELSVLVYCSKPLYSMLSGTQRIGVVASFRACCLLVFGVAETGDGSLSMKPWSFADDDEISGMLQNLLCQAMLKVFRCLSLADNTVFELWNILSQVVGFDPPPFVISSVNRAAKFGQWNTFVASSDVAGAMWSWRERGSWGVEFQQFVAKVLLSSQWPPNFDIRLLFLVYALVGNADAVWPESVDRIAFFRGISGKARNSTSSSSISFENLKSLIELLPRKWESNAASVVSFEQECALGFCVTNLKYLVDMGASESNYIERVKLFNEYLFALLSEQIGSAAHTTTPGWTSPSVTTFTTNQISTVVSELMHKTDTATFVPSLLSHSLSCLFAIVNTTEPAFFAKLWDGVSLSIKTSPNPLVWISSACKLLVSTELMANLVEKAIDRHISNASSSFTDVIPALQVPTLDTDGFLSNCIHHGFTFTLYVYALQQLQIPTPATIGEQIGLWLIKLNPETIHKQSSPASSRDGDKLIPLLDLYLRLLSREIDGCERSGIPKHHSKLYSMLPALAEAVLKWSEPANGGLWTTMLGLTPKVQFDPAFRVFCKSLSALMVMRVRFGDGSAVGEERDGFVEQVRGLRGVREYADVGWVVDGCVAVLEEEDGTLGVGESFGQMAALFSGIVQRGVLGGV